MHDLPFSYLAATHHLWHHAWTCEWMIMALKQGKHKINPNSTCDSKQTCESSNETNKIKIRVFGQVYAHACISLPAHNQACMRRQDYAYASRHGKTSHNFLTWPNLTRKISNSNPIFFIWRKNGLTCDPTRFFLGQPNPTWPR